MSFKREGNDASLLETLRKRRIKELLSEDIPEDEAKLLCNGRFACTVCPSNPVFDTVNVLTVHRAGKKHLLNLDVHAAKKRELKQLIAERKHQQYLKDGTTSIKMAVPVERGLITSRPYDPRVKKMKVQNGQRRPILEIGTNIAKTSGKNSGTKSGTSSGTSVQHSSHQKPQTSTAVHNGTCSSSKLKEAYEQSLSGPVMHGHQLKNIFTSKPEEHIRITPYQSKFRRSRAVIPQSSDISSLAKELPFTTVILNDASTKRLQTGAITNSRTCTASSSFIDPSSQKTFSSNITSEAVVSAKSSAMKPLLPCVVNPRLQAVVQSQNFVFTTPLLPPPPPPPPLQTRLLLPPPPPFAGTNDSSQTSSISCVTAASGKFHLHEDNGSLKQQKCVSEKLRQLQG
ncbi:hypothetical protein BsWGS_19110 [Bradybaena similaris]